MIDTKDKFFAIDKIASRINQFKVADLFDVDAKERNDRCVPEHLSDDQLLKVYATLIAFSQNANSKSVKKLIRSGLLDKIFYNFSVDKVAKMDSEKVINEYWKDTDVSCIRFKSKISQIIKFAKKITSVGSLSTLLTQTQLPKKISDEKDIEQFWKAFKILQGKLKEHDVPFLQSTTTLLHYLLDVGYDCMKPDIIVMKVAKKIGIVDNETGDANFRKTVKFVQQYSLNRGIRPAIVDLYFLVDQKQKAIDGYVYPEYYNLL